MHTFINALKVCTLQGMPRVRISATSSSAFRSCWWDPHWLITAGQRHDCHEVADTSAKGEPCLDAPPHRYTDHDGRGFFMMVASSHLLST